MTAVEKTYVHVEPAWRVRSNFIIMADLPENGRREQLWVRQVADLRFELCCIPYFLYDMSLGDVVETDDRHNVTNVIERSGRFVFRIWFGGSSYPQQQVIDELETLGGLTERASGNMIAVDAANAQIAQTLANLLLRHEAQRNLIYETGRQA
jgi:Domain of unknown function (DUF4265)